MLQDDRIAGAGRKGERTVQKNPGRDIFADEKTDKKYRLKSVLAGSEYSYIHNPDIRLYIPPWKKQVVRPEDLFAGTFEFINLQLTIREGKSILVPFGEGAPIIILHLPPQNIAEQAFFEPADEPGKEIPVDPGDKDSNKSDELAGITPHARALIAQGSRLVFRLPSTISSIDYTLPALLKACSDSILQVAPVAVDPGVCLLSPKITGCQKLARTAPFIQQAFMEGLFPVSGSAAFRNDCTLPDQTIGPWFRNWQATSGLAAMIPGTTDYLVDAVRADLGHIILDRTIRPPTLYETSIELPYRMILSPHALSGWIHATTPVSHGTVIVGISGFAPSSPEKIRKNLITVPGPTELWHTRLGFYQNKDGAVTIDEKRPEYMRVRAIWTRDWENAEDATKAIQAGNDPFRMSLSQEDRQNIVHLTSNYSLTDTSGHLVEPDPVQVNRLMLSSLGAWLDSRGAWDYAGCSIPGTDAPYAAGSSVTGARTSTLSVEEWCHRGTMGRDHYVRVVYKGYLFPFGHRASLVKITERKFHPGKPGNIAYLRQRMYIIVREPEKSYDESAFNREMPFGKIRILTTVTPDLDKPENSEVITGSAQNLFWPRVGSQDFRFAVVAEDWTGHTVEFTAPMIFVKVDYARDNNAINSAIGAYIENPSDKHDPTGSIPGRQCAIVRGMIENVTFDLDKILFSGKLYTPSEPDAPFFFPVVSRFHLSIPAIKEISGDSGAVPVIYDPDYLTEGLTKGKVFAQLVTGKDLSFDGKGDRSGGLVRPNLSITGLSQSTGLVGGDLATFKSADPNLPNGFDANAFFQGAIPVLFGVIPLTKIIKSIPSAELNSKLEKIPRFINEGETKRLVWNPDLENWEGIFVPSRNTDTPGQVNATLAISVEIVDKGGQKSTTIQCTMKDFTLCMIKDPLKFIALKFNTFEFIVKPGEKPVINVDFDEIEFCGQLSFLNELQKYIPTAGFSDPPVLDVTSEGIKAGYTLALPNITMGMFCLANLNVGAVLTLPFIGGPVSVRFNFCERQNPFLVTVSLFGGGGFFGIVIQPDGVSLLEAAIEFGAAVCLNFGVASGGVHVMAGIYFRLEKDLVQDKMVAHLAGYLRIGGEVDVLGLITASIELYMDLEFVPADNCAGHASLTIEVKVLFFSTSVSVTCERKFSGSSGDPTFADLMGPFPDTTTGKQVFPWNDYCTAFAPFVEAD